MDAVKTASRGVEFHKLGTRIRHARRLKRMRLKDVAEKAGCSESLLSKIECNKVQPSLHMLHAVASVLDTSIASLFSDSQQRDVSIFRAAERPVVVLDDPGAGTTIRLERLTAYREGQIIDGNVHVISPGASNGGEIKHTGEEIGYVLAGRLELTVGNTTFALEAGDSFHFRSDLPHSYRNPGASSARVVWINTPPTF